MVNFLNKNNAADQRVYQLLDEKFNLLREELDEQITEAMDQTRQQLLENFDSEVHEKLKVNLRASQEYLNRYESLLLQLTQHGLGDTALFDGKAPIFDLLSNPYPELHIPLGRYKLGPAAEGSHIYRLGHPLAQQLVNRSANAELPFVHLTFDYTNCPLQVSILKKLVGKSGQLSLTKLTIESAETQDHLIWSARTDDGMELDSEQCTRLFSVNASVQDSADAAADLSEQTDAASQSILAQIAEQNANYFEQEMDKLEGWADDRKRSLEINIKDLDVEIKTLKAESRKLAKLEDKVKAQRHIKQLEQKRTAFRRELFEAQDAIDQDKDGLLDSIEERLRQTTHSETLFQIKFSLT